MKRMIQGMMVLLKIKNKENYVMSHKQLAMDVLQAVGGQENVQ